jgi:ADP-heptose:LPS heptosyltransferase
VAVNEKGKARFLAKKLLRKVWQTFFYGCWILLRPLLARRPPPVSARHILLLPVGGIGNVILFTPVVSLLRKRYPEARIVVVLRSRGGAEVLRGFPNSDVLEFNFGSMWETIRFVRRHRLPRFDLAVNCETFYGAFLAALCRSRHIVSFTYSFGVTAQSDFLAHRSRNVDHAKHEVLQYFDLYRLIHPTTDRLDEGTFVQIGEEAARFARGRLAKCKEKGGFLVGMHVGSLPEVPEKRWPVERFAELATRLWRSDGAAVLLVGGKGEEPVVSRFRAAIARDVPLLDFAGKTSLKETGALIRECNLFVSNDSGPMHIAAAVGTPTVGIFGPTNPLKNRPWTRETPSEVVRLELACSPCYRAFSGFVRCTNRIHLECLEGISVDRVYAAARSLLPGV